MNALEDYINIVRGDPRFKDAAGNVSTWLSQNKKNSSVNADDFINKQESLRTTVKYVPIPRFRTSIDSIFSL
jgi:hypothetical protein